MASHRIDTIATTIADHTCFIRTLSQPTHLCLCGETFTNEGDHTRHVATLIAQTQTPDQPCTDCGAVLLHKPDCSTWEQP
jgi:hypothetical protein